MPGPLSHPVGVLYEIRWKEICPWLILVKALRVTLLIRVLMLAFLGALLTQWGSSAIDSVFSAPALSRQTTTDSFSTEEYLALDESVTSQSSLFGLPEASGGPLVEGWRQLSEPFLKLADREVSWRSSLVLLLHGAWAIVVWALFGGAIARIAALYLTRGETLGPLVALRDATALWSGTAGAPLIALLGATALAVPLVVLGMLLRLNLIAVIAGLFWLFVLAWGFMLAIVFVGLFIGWPLMWACLSVERSDGFDGVSRCYAYVYQRPLHLAFFVLVAAILGFFGEAIVTYFGSVLVDLGEWTLSWGMGRIRTADLLDTEWQMSTSPLAARLINGWKWGLASVVAAYPVACLWAMSVGIYLLLRRLVDATEMDEVALSDGTVQGGLPGLKTADSGVPEVDRAATNNDADAEGE